MHEIYCFIFKTLLPEVINTTCCIPLVVQTELMTFTFRHVFLYAASLLFAHFCVLLLQLIYDLLI